MTHQEFLKSPRAKVAYFSMEFAVDQALKIYSGGLGFLAGSHLRSAHSMNKELIGIGVLWRSGYYDQTRDEAQHMKPIFRKKEYSFLEDTGIKFQIQVSHSPVWVKAMFLSPSVFDSAPLYLLSTDLPENDFLSHTIVDKLYDPDDAGKIAQSILLGIGGGMLLDKLGIQPEVYHLNEGHGLPLAFYLYSKFKNPEEVKKHLVFTTHTPERAGNEEHSFELLDSMGFFHDVPVQEVRKLTNNNGPNFSYTVAALQFSRIANGVSAIHGKVSQELWGNNLGVCKIISITNAQKQSYWQDAEIKKAFDAKDQIKLIERKKQLKAQLFEEVADQTGKLFDPEILTIVWSRRFAGYKRADLLLRDRERFFKLINHSEMPVQMIWAGKPYPEDHSAIDQFNWIIDTTSGIKNCAVLTGYELRLSAMLKKGSDVWLNTPRYPREASGTSGMSAAMNASVNVSVADGWYPEFVKNGVNGFVIPASDDAEYLAKQDEIDLQKLYAILENEVIPLYYKDRTKWTQIILQSMQDVAPKFDSDRMLGEYFERMYNLN